MMIELLRRNMHRKMHEGFEGKKLNFFTVIKKCEDSSLWICLCDCGKEFKRRFSRIKSDHFYSCGCTHRPKNEENENFLKEKIIGKFKVINRSKDFNSWLCECKCGKKFKFFDKDIEEGIVHSCDCIKIKYGKRLYQTFKKCKYCEKEFNAKYHTSKFCSDKCFRHNRYPRKCKFCGICLRENPCAEFANGRKANFCSYECKIKENCFFDKNGCWIYKNARKTKSGLETKGISYKGRTIRPSRLSFLLHNKMEVDDDMYVMHKCDRNDCCNPKHMEIIERKDMRGYLNKNRMVIKQVNVNIINKIIELHEAGLTDKEITSQYNENFKYLAVASTRKP